MSYLEPRNHLSVPRRSDRAVTASLNLDSTAEAETCVPKGGKMVLKPKSGGGGGLRRVSRERVSFG